MRAPVSRPSLLLLSTDNHPVLTNDERWRFVWGALILYWAMDAILVFVFALVAFLVTLVVFLAAPSECSTASIVFTLSALLFVTRFVDMVLGCCTVGGWVLCRSGGGNNSGREKQLLPHIRHCIAICVAQCILS